MLESCLSPADLDTAWKAARCHVKIPPAMWQTFCDLAGSTPLCSHNTRTYHRYYARVKAVLVRNEMTFGCYTLDISRTGIGFLAPVPLQPNEKVLLLVPSEYRLPLRTVRCSRLGEHCYEIGATFRVRES